ncbi:MAG: hypothetical protein MJA31_02445 [Clostridia bacterium]|nr:hypothetical protein [Clostridia bacterium]
MKISKKSIIFLSIVILCITAYSINSISQKKHKELTALEITKIQEIQKEYISKVNIGGFKNPSIIKKTKKFYDDIISINELKYGENLVIATVNGWDITLDEIIFALAMQEALALDETIEENMLINKQIYESYFDKIVKTKIYYSIALDKEMLPEEREIYEKIDRDKKIWHNENPNPFLEFLDETFFWDNYMKFVFCGFITKINVANCILNSNKNLDPESEEAINYFNAQIQKEQNKANIKIIRKLNIP